ncbi:tyrosine-type recombinase/integrase [Devosia aurantiaca]|uniref:Tyrosine-type recombinase/integrase n=1 Tax=Devosia aurantiaca TaxID=2714858 RepID=A0A6M1SH38_9HYPH|nr:tyrosine-type recombinase/integrase [Devosia aurantiaca]NGP16518.1 tyrosine-type recombinase/integrase [Devosia aurantiaca]
MTTYLRGKIYHYEFQIDGQTFRGTTRCKNKRDADAFEKLRRQEILEIIDAQTSHPEVVTWKYAIDRYLADNHHMHSSRKDACRLVLGAFGPETPISETTDEAIHAMVEGEQIKHFLSTWRLPCTVEEFLVDIADERWPVQPGQKLSLQERVEIRNAAEAGSGSEALYYRKHKGEWTRRSYVDDPRGPLSNITLRNNIIQPIIAVLRYARDELYVVFRKFPNPRRHKYSIIWRLKTLSEADQPKLFDAMEEDLRDICEFALASMIRSKNLMDLTWEQVGEVSNYIRLLQKGDKPFNRYINDTMRRILEKRAGIHPVFVFTRMTEYADRVNELVPWTGWIKARNFRRAMEAANMTDLHFHDLRRTGATRMFDATNDIEAVRAALGHSHCGVTWRYIGRDPNDVETAEIKREARDQVMAMMVEAQANGVRLNTISAAGKNALIDLAVKARVLKSFGDADAQAVEFLKNLLLAENRPDAGGPIIDLIPNASGSGGRSGAHTTKNPDASKAKETMPVEKFLPTFIKRLVFPGHPTYYLWAPFDGAEVVQAYTDGPEYTLHLVVRAAGYQAPPAPLVSLHQVDDLEELLCVGPICVQAGQHVALVRDIKDLEAYRERQLSFDDELFEFTMDLVNHESSNGRPGTALISYDQTASLAG